MPTKNPDLDSYFTTLQKWPAELAKLRTILLGCGLTEELKWRNPCYSFADGNVAIIGELKDCCTLSFFKGALLRDPAGLLEKPGENTQAARVIRLTSVAHITRLKPALVALTEQAIELEKAGAKVEFKKEPEPIPAELQAAFDADAAFVTAFDALTPGRQRAYIMFIAAAKQAKTRASRIEQYRQQIIDGKGINDCTCGLSKKMPSCDGSHKFI